MPTRLSIPEREWIEDCARAAGFALCGVAPVPEDESEDAAKAGQRFAEWVQAGHAGEMEYLKRSDESGEYLRGGLRRAIPWARSVVVCAVNYNTDAPRSIDPAPADAAWIARYAWSGNDGKGSDYHDVLLTKLRAVETRLLERFGGETRCYVDTGPIAERDYAARAGVGWIGKNTCVLNQEQGSWLLLGVIVTSLELEREALPMVAADRCGSCTSCIDACPTEALLWSRERPERVMDATRCIAYLTIEKKGSIAPQLRGKMGRQVFGCDICQDVCPWNCKSPVPMDAALPARKELVNPALEWLAAMDGHAFNRWFRGSPLERTRRKRILRNVAIAMGNSGDAKFLPQLKEWASSEDGVLAESAAWAVANIDASLATK